ncbi:MAG: cation transporter [Alkalinema sp. RU_4_3]|nr:cation transporter [Alkalinema sp. RU_4_3]
MQQKFQVVKTTLALLIVLFFAQWAIGHWSGSLALQADASHLFSDVLALGITLLAIALARRPAGDRATFGHQRVEILAALFNGLSLLGISGWILYVSLMRWQAPQDVLSLPMLMGSLLGLAINGFNLWALSQGGKDLNIRAAFLHTASDFVGSIGAMIAGISIHLWHCLWIDTCIGFMVAGITLMSAVPLLQESLEVMLEYAPKSLDLKAVRDCLTDEPSIVQVETLRVWSLTRENIVVCLHLKVSDSLNDGDRDRLLKRLQARLRTNFQIQEAIIQISSSSLHPSALIHPLLQPNLLEQVRNQSCDL